MQNKRGTRRAGWLGLGLFLGLTLGIASAAFRVFPYPQIRDLSLMLLPTLEEQRPSDMLNDHRIELFERTTPDVDVVMIGDSITAGGLWQEFLPLHRFANRGLSGDTAEGIFARLDAILATTPETAVIMVGINDLTEGRAVADILTDYTAILDRLGAEGLTVHVISALSCSRDGCEAINPGVQALNAGLQRAAQDRNLNFIDLNAQMSDQNGLRADFTYDGVHLNADGYALFTQALSDALGD